MDIFFNNSSLACPCNIHSSFYSPPTPLNFYDLVIIQRSAPEWICSTVIKQNAQMKPKHCWVTQLFLRLNRGQLLLNYVANVPFISSMTMWFINCYVDCFNQLISTIYKLEVISLHRVEWIEHLSFWKDSDLFFEPWTFHGSEDMLFGHLYLLSPLETLSYSCWITPLGCSFTVSLSAEFQLCLLITRASCVPEKEKIK